MIQRRSIGNREPAWLFRNESGGLARYSTIEEADHQVKLLNDEFESRFTFTIVEAIAPPKL